MPHPRNSVGSTLPCPDCTGGTMQRMGLVRRAETCTIEPIPCHTCNDTGTITLEHMNAILRGKKMQLERIYQDKSLREKAKELGMTAVELSDMEHGRVHDQQSEATRTTG